MAWEFLNEHKSPPYVQKAVRVMQRCRSSELGGHRLKIVSYSDFCTLKYSDVCICCYEMEFTVQRLFEMF